jgi:hypothetical protein
LKVKSLVCLLAVSLALAFFIASKVEVFPVAAKPTLSLSFYKNNGSGIGNDICGLFTVNTEVSADVAYVEFYLDNQLQLNSTAAPFSWPFDTNNYALGLHTIKVVAYDSSGDQTTVEAQRNFVEFPLLLVVGIIAAVAAALVVAFDWAIYKVRKQKKNKN